ncbi:MAG: hypothetical protein U5M23_00045 [Marinagarivorans sp.]|nr:hypothetical protein [Marinagarivorans sp.]
MSWLTLLSCKCKGSLSTLATISRRPEPPVVAENSMVCWRLHALANQTLHVIGKAHVEHAVGFVEHQHFDFLRGPGYRR